MTDPKQWARVIVAEFEAGKCQRTRTVIRLAHEALGLPVPKGFK